jgi:endogenous inhibitor of DNA gyrase (YacG/DUF329 family)
LNPLEQLTKSGFSITCGQCGKTSDALDWTERPVSGPLPTGTFQCPRCGFAFRRRGAGPVRLFKDSRGRVVDAIHEQIRLEPVQAVM